MKDDRFAATCDTNPKRNSKIRVKMHDHEPLFKGWSHNHLRIPAKYVRIHLDLSIWRRPLVASTGGFRARACFFSMSAREIIHARRIHWIHLYETLFCTNSWWNKKTKCCPNISVVRQRWSFNHRHMNIFELYNVELWNWKFETRSLRHW